MPDSNCILFPRKVQRFELGRIIWDERGMQHAWEKWEMHTIVWSENMKERGKKTKERILQTYSG